MRLRRTGSLKAIKLANSSGLSGGDNRVCCALRFAVVEDVGYTDCWSAWPMSLVTLPTTRFTVDELFRLVEADALGTSRVELLNGRIYRMPPQGGPHMTAVSRTMESLIRARSPKDWVIVQGTLILSRYFDPEPDLLWLPVPLGTPVQE